MLEGGAPAVTEIAEEVEKLDAESKTAFLDLLLRYLLI